MYAWTHAARRAHNYLVAARHRHRIARAILVLVVLLFITGCTVPRSTPPNASVTPSAAAVCPERPSWKGILPGRSSRQDVIAALGQPSGIGTIEFGEHRWIELAYDVDGGVVADFLQDRIVLDLSDIVQWVEVVAADRGGQFQQVGVVAQQLGAAANLDTVYENSNYRPGRSNVLAGPDVIYVWSSCGLAVDAVSLCRWLDQVPCGSQGNLPTQGMVPRILPSPDAGPFPDASDVVIKEFLFAPTSYVGFEDYYKFRIPHEPELLKRYIGQLQYSYSTPGPPQ